MQAASEIQIAPQPGPQQRFLESDADFVCFGGGVAGGKSFALLLESLYDLERRDFRAAIFRKTVPQLRQPGGLLDSSQKIFPLVGGKLNATALEWEFPSGAKVKLASCELASDRFNWYGSQFDYLALDEGQEFTSDVFWFLVSRNRGTSGAKCRVRLSCNPDPDSYLLELISWWIGADGFPIPERSGKLRWFIRAGDTLEWADSKAELLEKFTGCHPRSLTFIGSLVHDNPALLKASPDYIAQLEALPRIDRERLLRGNWAVRASAGNFFRREWFTIVDSVPRDIVSRCRFWDRAASVRKPGTDPDATCGVLLSKDNAGVYTVENVIRAYLTPGKVSELMLQTAHADGIGTTVGFNIDPGSAGKYESEMAVRDLDGFNVRCTPASGDKATRAKPISAQAEAGRVRIVRGPWNDAFLRELEGFPDARHDDAVDALSGAHQMLGVRDGSFTAADLASMEAVYAAMPKQTDWLNTPFPDAGECLETR